MKIILLTYCDENYSIVGEKTKPSILKFCNTHNITFKCFSEKVREDLDIYWNKIELVKRELFNYDCVIWCDIDILFLKPTNNDIIEMLNKNSNKQMYISKDHRGLCLGFFAVKSSIWSKELLSNLLFLGNIKKSKIGIYDNKNRLEQDSLKVIYDFYENISSHIQLINEDIISNPKSKTVKNSIAHHFWANSNLSETVEEIQNML